MQGTGPDLLAHCTVTIVLLCRDIAVFLLVTQKKLLKISDLHNPVGSFFINKYNIKDDI